MLTSEKTRAKPTPRRWIIAPSHPLAHSLAADLKTSPILAQILLNRGLTDAESARRFLSPTLKHLHDPALIPGLQKAARRILQAIAEKQKIVIYGDYDVDGISACAILWHAIMLLGGVVEYYIPHRLEEGYGLNCEAIRQICDSGAKLIVSVDCGITALEEAALCLSKGVDLIITDHHEWRESPPAAGVPSATGVPSAAGVLTGGIPDSAMTASEDTGGTSGTPLLPQCYGIVHPRLPTADGAPPYPNPDLCGAGVAFKLAWGLGLAHQNGPRVSDTFRQFLINATALATLATIADVVSLHGENRMLAHFGLNVLPTCTLPGIQALLASASLKDKILDSESVGFGLAPRLNACGRMAHAREAVELLTHATPARAAEICTELNKRNNERKSIEKKVLDEALQQATTLGFDDPAIRGVVLGSDSWHSGVIGIVAARVVSKLQKPAVLVALNNGHGHGSGRSIAGFDLARAFAACGDHLENHGGHDMAAGLQLETARLPDFRAAFAAYAAEHVSDEMMMPQLHLDSEATLPQSTPALLHDLDRLGPFGMGNPKPLLLYRNVELTAVRPVGDGQHVQLRIRQSGQFMKCIAFKRPELAALQAGIFLDLAAQPNINEYQGMRSVELEVKDLRPTSP